jgi:hypothetical protein
MEYASVAQTNMNSITYRHIFAGTKFSTVTNSQSGIISRVARDNRHHESELSRSRQCFARRTATLHFYYERKSAKGVPAVGLWKALGFLPQIA